MNKKMYLSAQEVGILLGVSKPHAYRLVKEMNDELKSKGYIVIAGRVPTVFFEEKIYGASQFPMTTDTAVVNA